MSSIELIVVAFDQADKADQALKDIKALAQHRVIQVMNAAVLTNRDGKVSVKETEDVDAKHGALFGAITGGLIGALAGPGGVIVGAVAGATTGGVAAHGIDMGFPDADLNELRDALPPNSSALVALIETRWVEKMAEDLAYLEGKLYRHALRAEIEAEFAAEVAEMDRRLAAIAEKQAAMRQELYADTTGQFQAWQAEIEALEAKMETAAADKKAELHRQVEALREKVKTGRDALNKKIEAQLQEWRADIVALRNKATKAEQRAKIELQQQIEALQLKQDAARAEMQQNLAAQVEARRAEVENLKAKAAASAAEAKAKLQAQLATAQANWVSAWDKLQAAMEAQLQAAEADLDEFEVQVALGTMEAKDEFNEFIATLQARHYAARQKFQHALETQLQEMEANLEQDVEKLRARQAQIEAKLQALRTSSRAAGQDLASGMAKAKGDLKEAGQAAKAEFK